MYSCETVWVKRCFYQKDGWLQSEITMYKHYNGKKQTGGGGGGVGLRMMNFQG